MFTTLIAENGLNVSDIFSTGGITTLIGLGMTFVVLTILICCIIILKYVLKYLEKHFPKLKISISNFFSKIFKKKNKNDVVAEPVVEKALSNETTNCELTIDEDTKAIVTNSALTFVKQSYTDGKEHNNVKILSITPLKEDSNE